MASKVVEIKVVIMKVAVIKVVVVIILLMMMRLIANEIYLNINIFRFTYRFLSIRRFIL